MRRRVREAGCYLLGGAQGHELAAGDRETLGQRHLPDDSVNVGIKRE